MLCYTPGFAVKVVPGCTSTPSSASSASKGRHLQTFPSKQRTLIARAAGPSHTARRAPPRPWRLSGCDVQSFVAAGDFDCPNGGSTLFAHSYWPACIQANSRPQSATNSCSPILNIIHASSPRHEHLSSWPGMCRLSSQHCRRHAKVPIELLNEAGETARRRDVTRALR